MVKIPNPNGAVARVVRGHALGWLVAANAVGLWLAALLLWPTLGDVIAPLSYGRWMPVHMNWQLYGWCALPLVGLLFRWILVAEHPGVVRHVHVALCAWSLALGLGGVSWLGGTVSGKLFLDWHGWARPVLALAMLVLWTVLAAHLWWGWRSEAGWQRWAKLAVLGGLVAVPPLMWWVAGRDVYPAVNRDSGGATGAALLGSTLGIVGIFGFMPRLLGVSQRAASKQDGSTCHVLRDKWWRGGEGWFWGAYGVSIGAWLAIERGDSSHHDVEQIVGLGVLLAWIPLLIWWWRRQAWCAGARPWILAALAWWALLVLTGWLTFLPELSERLKFTNGLVAHAHLAMAGLVTSVNAAILNQLDPARPLRRGFGLWQGGAAVMVVVLLVMGWFERDHAAAFFYGDAWWVDAGYGVRLAAGVAMALASVQLLRETTRR
ncbi:hypothetical protein [Actomonas aquatica]|uniref:Cytochrome oxidase subunit I profile domain-containing protein n=1 Tax=Actomonas aquatica TaxID=2866162 RepID=A0ABZ1C425_9BACT|nr:hypothetical protein [Opitutus sp. WL0086]WRQ86473.1 hypothetical protein K1X11_016780 [Opitutus sp. WL0086]